MVKKRMQFFGAKCGYAVTVFDISEQGIEEAKRLAKYNEVEAPFFKANTLDYSFDTEYDIIFSSGVLHFVPWTERKEFCDSLKSHTTDSGINVLNVFVPKPFISRAPDSTEEEEKVQPWHSGELFDCNSSGIPHKHCMDTLIAQKAG